MRMYVACNVHGLQKLGAATDSLILRFNNVRTTKNNNQCVITVWTEW